MTSDCSPLFLGLCWTFRRTGHDCSESSDFFSEASLRGAVESALARMSGVRSAFVEGRCSEPSVEAAPDNRGIITASSNHHQEPTKMLPNATKKQARLVASEIGLWPQRQGGIENRAVGK